MLTLPPDGHMQSVSSPDDFTLYPIGSEVQLIRRCMLPAIPVGATGKVMDTSKDDAPIMKLLVGKGKYVKVEFNLASYNVKVNQNGQDYKLDRCLVYCGTDELRPYDAKTFTHFIVMCVGNAQQEYKYAYFRPDDYLSTEWNYLIAFEDKATVHHYFKDLHPEEYMTEYRRHLKAGIVSPVPIRHNQPFSPFQ